MVLPEIRGLESHLVAWSYHFDLPMLAGLVMVVSGRTFPESFTLFNEHFERIPITLTAKLLTEGVGPGHPFRKIMILDARYPMEYAGGHIRGAMNVQHQREPAEEFYRKYYSPDILFITHCEFSMVRGPALAAHLINAHSKAKRKTDLHVVVMNGGFSAFYPWFRELCDGTYWPEQRLDPGRPENVEFLRLANEAVKQRKHAERPI